MNNTKTHLDPQYLLGTSYAEYAKNHLSQFFPKKLLELRVTGDLDNFLIKICSSATDQYDLYFDSMDNSSIEQRSTNHIIAKEHANKLIEDLINQHDS